MNNNLIEELIQSNCIKIGNFVLKNGDQSKYYYDIKNLISYPRLLMKVGKDIDTDYIIVGRAIYNSDNMVEAIKKFM